MFPEWVLNRITAKIDVYFEPMMKLLRRMLVVMEQIRDRLPEVEGDEDAG